jgi:hypothetical protein
LSTLIFRGQSLSGEGARNINEIIEKKTRRKSKVQDKINVHIGGDIRQKCRYEYRYRAGAALEVRERQQKAGGGGL